MNVNSETTFVREVTVGEDQCLNIHQLQVGDVGCVVWDAALVLLKYFEMKDFIADSGQHLFEKSSIIELGSGTGVVGLGAALYGANVLLTDLEESLPLMQLNIDVNKEVTQKGQCRCASLKWGQETSEFMIPDYILLADCLYYDESLNPLVKTLEELCGPKTQILFSYEQRTTGNKPFIEKQFFNLMKSNFSCEKISNERLHPEFQSYDIHVLKFTKNI